jgi:hypothetical protein
MTKVFIIPFHVKPMENSIMPPGLKGAYVSCYSQGETYVEATEKALKKLDSDGLYPEEILQPIHEMESSLWAEHIKNQWPDYVNNLPTQEEFDDAITGGNVIYGPFGSYNPS